MTTSAQNSTALPDPAPQEGTQLIGGRWVPARGGDRIAVLNPATEQPLSHVPRATGADIDDAVAAAQAAQPAWAATDPGIRAELLRQWGRLTMEHAVSLELIECMEVGRPLGQAIPLFLALDFVAGQVDKVTGLTLPVHSPDALGFTLREPYGVVGSIIPWNAPAAMFVGDVAPAIGAGNTIVVKPAEDAPLAALALAALAERAGIPAGVINVVTGYGHEAGAALAAHPGIRRMSFTGSPAVGAAVMAACAKNHTPLHLELGGKSPQVVFADADLDAAVPAIVRGITFNTGQICMAGTRLVVEESVRAEVVDRIAQALEAVRIGRWDEQADMGPLINRKQKERVMGYIEVGRKEGATLVTGGGDPGGLFVEPTLFDDVERSMRIAQEEIFGPVLSVLPVADESEAVAVANDTEYGLAAYLWTRDTGRAIRVAKALQAGQVTVNAGDSFQVIGAPFGGYKHSGFGRTMGADSVLNHTQSKTVVINASAVPGGPMMPPPGAAMMSPPPGGPMAPPPGFPPPTAA
ncbi:aldehyde dehydrogenase family protein [Streptomyces sp. NPDC058464]|uniref:aldehyde dehydrogenase family protein n=1 Tax=Streptomyces sp. NPDC058464 TaxID=3346511 RepID=UPI00364E244D